MKIRKHFVEKDGLKVRVIYSKFNAGELLTDTRAGVTIYQKDWGNNLLKIFKNAKNESCLLSDYHEQSRVHIFKDNNLYKEVIKYANN